MIVLSVISPVYSEVATIGEAVKGFHAFLLALCEEIVVMNDGSPDGTLEVVRRLGDLVDRVNTQATNTGKRAAVRFGFRSARGEIAIIQDAHLKLDPSEYWTLLEPIVSSRGDLKVGRA